MRVFSYLPGKMAPLDQYVLEIYRQYVAYNQEIIHIWRRGVINGLMAERNFVDLAGARLRLDPLPRHPGVYAPVISLTPILGEVAETNLTRFVEFFKLYHQLRAASIEQASVLDALENMEHDTGLPSKEFWKEWREPYKKAKRNLHLTANLTKLLITAFHLDDAWDPQNPLIRWSITDKDWIFVGTDMARIGGHVVGPHFLETGEADKDFDGPLIKAIRRYTLQSNQSDLFALTQLRHPFAAA